MVRAKLEVDKQVKKYKQVIDVLKKHKSDLEKELKDTEAGFLKQIEDLRT